MNILKFVLHNRRAFLYSFFLSVGFGFIIYIRETSQNFENFLYSLLLLYFLLFVEIIFTYKIALRKLKQFNIPMVRRYNSSTQTILHIVLPSLLFWSFGCFIWINLNPGFWILLIPLIFFLYTILFINIRAYYLDKFVLEKNTHNIYELIKTVVYSLDIFIVTMLSQIYELENLAILGILFSLNLIFFCLIFLTKLHILKITYKISILILAVILTSFSYYLTSTGLDVFSQTFYATIVYYLCLSLLNHKLNHTLNREIVLEYVSFFLLAISLFASTNHYSSLL